jgi:putative ABC transport system permease protein
MILSYLKIAWRNLFKNRLHSLINITGLALGMAAAALLALNILFGLSFDQFHQKKDRLFLTYSKGVSNGETRVGWGTSPLLAPVMQVYPEVASTARISGSSFLFRYEDKKLDAWGDFTDPSFLQMFSFPLVEGNAASALKDPNDIVITQRLAAKLFGTTDPMGKVLASPTGDNFTVTGVMKTPPPNTRFNTDYLINFSFIKDPGGWNNWNTETWVELKPGADVDAYNAKVAHVMAHTGASDDRSFTKQIVFLYPITQVYLKSKFDNGVPVGGNIDNLKMLGGLAIIILVIACINFMNLTTARSEKRSKEVGIRKVVGAQHRSLVLQFIAESVLMSFMAGIIAFALVQMAIPQFNALMDVQLELPYESLSFWASALGFIVFTGVLAGSYPAFYLSSFKPAKVLKGRLQRVGALVTPRKILVVVQFVCSILLINLAVIYQKQIRYELDREVGYTKDKIVFHPLNSELRRNYTALRNELINSGAVASLTESSTTVTRGDGKESGLTWAGRDPSFNPWFVLIMENGDFVKTNELTLVEGRDIDIAKYPGDTLSCVINETSVKMLGFKHPVGQIINDVDERWKIVGVVKDFLSGDPDQQWEPLLIKGAVDQGYISMRLSDNQPFIQNARLVEDIIRKYNPDYITELLFADKDYADKFQQARNTAMLINTFTFIAIFISCMGLLGLATYMAENRTREIGIRKVLGSSIPAIVTLLGRDFVRLVFIAVLIASPLAWWLIHHFLAQFAYRTTFNGWVLVISGMAALLLALVTVSFQTIRAAMANPVKSLRSE